MANFAPKHLYCVRAHNGEERFAFAIDHDDLALDDEYVAGNAALPEHVRDRLDVVFHMDERIDSGEISHGLLELCEIVREMKVERPKQKRTKKKAKKKKK